MDDPMHLNRGGTRQRGAAGRFCRAAVTACLIGAGSVIALDASQVLPPADYVIGPQDVLLITVYDQDDLTGKFPVDADGTFTFPLIGRVKAGGLTLRELEAGLKQRLMDGYFTNPLVRVAVEQYRSQRVFILGEVRNPGAYALSGNMSMLEAMALAGSALPTASGEALVVRGGSGDAAKFTLPAGDKADVDIVDVRALLSGAPERNLVLRDGDTIFVPRAESAFVFGQVKNPGAIAIQRGTTVLQALSLSGGVTDRGATGRIRIVRLDNGKRVELKAKLDDIVRPGDTIIVPERYF